MKHGFCAYILSSIVIILFACSGLYGSEKLTEYKGNWGKFEFQGRIDYISVDEGYLLVSEKKVVLVDLEYKGKQYITVIRNANGKELQFEDLNVGDWVFVFGGRYPDKSIAARTIFLLSHKLSAKQFKKYSDLAISQESEYLIKEK